MNKKKKGSLLDGIDDVVSDEGTADCDIEEDNDGCAEGLSSVVGSLLEEIGDCEKVGKTTGFPVGSARGERDGRANGKVLGFVEGRVVGYAEGAMVGGEDGRKVGNEEGNELGIEDG